MIGRLLVLLMLLLAAAPPVAMGEALPREAIADRVLPPYALGQAVNDKGVWELLNSGGGVAGFAFETGMLAPLPGFSGSAINLFVMLDREGRFIHVSLISQNEPVFVSGLGEAPLNAFLEQYRGLSIDSPIAIGRRPSDSDGGQYLEGVAKATASVRIAHESILAAALEVAREKMKGVSAKEPARPDPAIMEPLNWAGMVEQGIVRNLRVTQADLDAAFADSKWEDDEDRLAAEADLPVDLWVADIGPPSVAEALLGPDSLAELKRLLVVAPDVEPIFVLQAGSLPLTGESFVRNTTPDLLGMRQNDLPVDLRDADILVETKADVPEGQAMILRVDRRLGFDPLTPWTLQMFAERRHGNLQPEAGRRSFDLTYQGAERFYLRPVERAAPRPPWLEAAIARGLDLSALLVFLAGLSFVLYRKQQQLASHRYFKTIRLAVLAVTALGIGWWGQGQLSVVTLLGVLRAAAGEGGFAFLLYDPFSLVIWLFAIAGFFAWGRGYFCGWLCPYGALQEFTAALGRLLRLPRYELPAIWDARLKWVKYGALAVLVGAVFATPDRVEAFAEIEPFKTAITTGFHREWIFVAYAGFWLVLGMVTHKPFCRYLCPLGAAMAVGGGLRRRAWIERRSECGSPCQLCRVRCPYAAIGKDGRIGYAECFHCLDCVTIHADAKTCVPRVLETRKQIRRAA
jgi:transcriptional regulator of nitric oxide reductase/ferredoxin